MLPNKRAIDRGFGVTHCASVGFKMAFATSVGCFPAKWIGADSAFGSDIEFLDALPKERFYFAAIKSDTQVFTKKPKVGLPPYKGRGRRPTKPKILPGQPKPRSVAEIAKSDRVSWKPVVVAEGATGPIIAKVARIRVYLSRDGLPVGDQQWLFFRKNTDGEIKYAISNAPKETSLSETVEGAMEIVQYHLIRNLTAYRSHRKKRVKLAKIHNINLSL
jgi:SRSO17 transposase